VLELHRRAMTRSVEVVDAIIDDQWDLPTPCSRWTLRQLVEHMTSDNLGFAAAARGERHDRSVWTFAAESDDLRADYARSALRVIADFNAVDLAPEFWLPRINDAILFPAPQAISFHLLDYAIHGWDVAVSIGVPFQLDDEMIAVVADIAEREVPDGPRRLRPEAGFRPPVRVPDEAAPQDRLLAALGRTPTWPA
jgi:uncharacterized protein (TIGR03086 family)